MTALKWAEELKGYLGFGETDFDRGSQRGKEEGTFVRLDLTLGVDDVDGFVAERSHAASEVGGFVDCGRLGGQRPVEQGWFNLFLDEADPTRTHMLYRLFFTDDQGNQLTLTGFKDIKDDPHSDLWRDTTTLFTRILGGHLDPPDEASLVQGRFEGPGDADAKVWATGILYIHLTDFLRILTTFRPHGGGPLGGVKAVERFGRAFMGKLWDVYGPGVHEAAGTGKAD